MIERMNHFEAHSILWICWPLWSLLDFRISLTLICLCFRLQAGILILVQAITIMTLFPVLLKLDSKRRARNRMDVLCCLRQPLAAAPPTTAVVSSDVVTNPDGSTSPAQPPPYHQISSSSSRPSEGVVRVVETTSARVRLNEHAVATVRVSVSTQQQPSTALIHDGVNVS